LFEDTKMMAIPYWNRRNLLALLPSACLAGCGFALRQTPELPFDSLHLSGFAPGSTMAAALRRHLLASHIALHDSPVHAHVVLRVLLDTNQRTVVASTSAAQVRAIQLRTLLRFSLTSTSAQVLLPVTDIALVRDLTYNERNALAKEQEEAASILAMQDDIAGQVLRRLAAMQRSE
jgi:LPS-assembly lipoprotein